MYAIRSPARLTLRLLTVLLLCLGTSAQATDQATRYPAAIASAHPLATQAGLDILAQGGNAFDAAITVSAVLAVVEPYSSGLGGGGFWLLHRATDGKDILLDGREKAPAAAHRDLYLDADGEVIPRLSIDGPLAAGIPGEPAALAHLAKHYGRLPLSQSLAPAIALARQGFPVDDVLRRFARFRAPALQRWKTAGKVFLVGGKAPREGEILRQPALADTLQRLAAQGRDGFYSGPTAQALVDGVRQAGGIWGLKDLNEYRVVERQPIRGHYHDMQIISAAPPSSGGVVLVEMLNILAGFDLQQATSSQRVHLLVEAMRRAYRDRAEYLGDPDQVAMPLARLTSSTYATQLRAHIRPQQATPSYDLPRVKTGVKSSEGDDTTHFSILDHDGNRVAATLSINYPFGSGFMPPGTGVLLNDEMDDFSARPGTPNVYGLVGNEANAIAPGKRMLSSMTPTFLEQNGKIAILGTPGGSRIITMVLQAALDFAAGQPPEHWVRLRRFHHQYLPDQIQFEPGALSPRQQRILRDMGHHLAPKDNDYGNLQAILLDTRTGQVQAASDPRGIGQAKVVP